LIAKICLNPKVFSSHNLRRGGATLADQAGISSSLIQLMGDWKSGASTILIQEMLKEEY
jgi:integrase